MNTSIYYYILILCMCYGIYKGLKAPKTIEVKDRPCGDTTYLYIDL